MVNTTPLTNTDFMDTNPTQLGHADAEDFLSMMDELYTAAIGPDPSTISPNSPPARSGMDMLEFDDPMDALSKDYALENVNIEGGTTGRHIDTVTLAHTLNLLTNSAPVDFELKIALPDASGCGQSVDDGNNSQLSPEQGQPILSPEDIETRKDKVIGVAKTQLDATVVALALHGCGTIAKIAEVIVEYRINLKFASKPLAKRKGDITGCIANDKVVRSILIPDKNGKSRSTHKPKPENAQYFAPSGAERPAKFHLRSAGITRARQLLCLATENTDLGSFTLNSAFEHILMARKICTFDDILAEFETGEFCTYQACWSNCNPSPGQSPGDFNDALVKRALGRYLKQHAAGESNENGAIFSYSNNYWLSRFGMQPIFDKLAPDYSKLLEQGLEFHKPLMEYRVKSRRYEDICHNKLTLNGVYGPRTIGEFDFTWDAPNLVIPLGCEHNFFDIRESTLPGAGNGGYARVSFPAGTLLMIDDANIYFPPKNTTDNIFLPYGFSLIDPDTNQKFEYNTLLPDGTVSCVAGHLNDSCDAEQHFVIECFPRTESNGERKVDLFLRARRKIKAGEEVFVDYGADYWKAAIGEGVRQSSKSAKKKRSRKSTRQAHAKRGKLTVESLPLPEFVNTVLPLFNTVEEITQN